MNYKSPIIISGMHRSGTSLLTNILHKNNVYIGSRLDANLESVFFQRINKWILSCIGSSWDNPRSLYSLNTEDLTLLEHKISKVLDNRLPRTLYFGANSFFSNKNFFNQSSNWLWKDPQNTFTLNIWMKIFPDSKIINIVRHPLDVSISLLKREEELKKIDRSLLVPNIVSLFLPILSVNKGDVLSSFNLKTIDDCLILYNKYYKEMDKNLNLCKNIINIKFEELIENPKRILNKVFDFINVEISINSLAEIKKIIDRKRSLAYKNQIINYDTNLLDEINY